MKMISALVKRPGEPPRHVNLSDRLESLQTPYKIIKEIFHEDRF